MRRGICKKFDYGGTSIFPENEDSTLAAATFEMESNNESDSNEQMNFCRVFIKTSNLLMWFLI